MRVHIFGAEKLKPAERTLLERGVLAGLGPMSRRSGEICLILVTDRKIRTLNKQFLGKDRVTDVIAFPYEPPPGRVPDAPLGDIYLATGAAKRQARTLGHSGLDELVTLAVHGALHLRGYEDGTIEERERMFAAQERAVRRVMRDGKAKKKAKKRAHA